MELFSKDTASCYKPTQPSEKDTVSHTGGASALHVSSQTSPVTLFGGRETKESQPNEQLSSDKCDSELQANLPVKAGPTYASCVRATGSSQTSKVMKSRQPTFVPREDAVRDKVNKWLPNSFKVAEEFYKKNQLKAAAIYYYCKALSRVSKYTEVCRLMSSMKDRDKHVSLELSLAARILHAESLLKLGLFDKAEAIIASVKKDEPPHKIKYFCDACRIECQILSIKGRDDEAKQKLKRAITQCESKSRVESISHMKLLGALESVTRKQIMLSQNDSRTKEYEKLLEKINAVPSLSEEFIDDLFLAKFDFYVEQNVVDLKMLEHSLQEAKKIQLRKKNSDAVRRQYSELSLIACEKKLEWRKGSRCEIVKDSLVLLDAMHKHLTHMRQVNHPFLSKQLELLEEFSSTVCAQLLSVENFDVALSVMALFIEFTTHNFPDFKMSNRSRICFAGVMLKRGQEGVAKDILLNGYKEDVMISVFILYIELQSQFKSNQLESELEIKIKKLGDDNSGNYQVRNLEGHMWLQKSVLAFKNKDEDMGIILKQAEHYADKYIKDFNSTACYTLRAHLASLRGDSEKAQELYSEAKKGNHQKEICHNPAHNWFETNWRSVIESVL